MVPEDPFGSAHDSPKIRIIWPNKPTGPIVAQHRGALTLLTPQFSRPCRHVHMG
jgi:hypothetical protein